MARRRKIPGKKHHGVKDPEVQKERREEKLRSKESETLRNIGVKNFSTLQINSAPKIVDSQEVPKRLRMLMRDRERMLVEQEAKAKARKEVREGKVSKPKIDPAERDLLDSSKHMGYEMRLPGMKRPLKPIPVFKQKPGESQKTFFNRMEKTVQAVLKRKEYEDKYDVDVIDNPETGETTVKNREKDEVDEELEKIANKKKSKKGIALRSKEEKRRLKRLKEKEKKAKKKRGLRKLLDKDDDDVLDFTDFQDEVKFNEVASAPPMLKQVKGTESRVPGKSSSLLLSAKLAPKNSGEDKISMAKKHMLERERTRVIEEYRKLKMSKLNKVKL